MIRSALLAVAFVLVGAAGGSGEYELSPAGYCAVDEASCRMALQAHRAGWLWPEAEITDCRPHVGCRDARELCIRGFNC